MNVLFKIKTTTLIGLGITFLTSYIYFPNPEFLNFLELKILDQKFKMRGELEPGDETVIAAIDEKSLDELGRWPWSRDIQAKLVNKLTEYGAKVIAFDVVFSEEDSNPGLKKIIDIKKNLQGPEKANPELINLLSQIETESDTDKQFADALKKSERTILGYFFHFSETGLSHLKQEQIKHSFENIRGTHYNSIRFAGEGAISVSLPEAYAVESNISKLFRASAGAGFFSFKTDVDGAIRKMPLIVKYNDLFFPPLAISAIKNYLNLQVSFYIQDYGVDSVEIGDTLIPTDNQGQLLINFYGPQKTFPHYSVSDILNKRIQERFLKDKIVIIGPTAFGIYDLRLTPFATNYPGAEIHATVIDNILHKRFLMKPEWVGAVDLLLILLSGLVGAFVSSRMDALRSLLILLLMAAFFLYANYYLFLMGIQASLIYPLLNLAIIYIGVTIYRLFTEGKEKRFIKSAFAHYLSPTVINQLISNPNQLKLGGERKVLTAFFSDVAGFSAISEKLTPEGLVELLNIYLTEMTDIILKYEGTVDKFEGDAIISFFGAPVPFEDHAKRACLATIEMQERQIELRKQWKIEGKPALFTRIGLNTGPMVVGNMGSMSRMDYTMMGDSVNLAARLEGVNKQYGTFSMISESSYEGVKDCVEVRKLDIIRVVGKSEPVTVYELICKKGRINPDKKKTVSFFHDGLSFYFERQWDKAIGCFENALNIGIDAPSEVFIKRCGAFKIDPPPPDWDGVFSLKEK